jgi:antitoxin PrlF
MKTIIREGGRLVIPSAYRKALGLKPGDEVLLILEEGEIRIISARRAVTRAQSLVRRYIPQDKYLSAELILERHKEASHRLKKRN